MTISVEKLPDCKARLSVEFPPAEVEIDRSQIVSLYARKAKLPGFRPGKVPRATVEKRFQKEIQGELSERLVSRACEQAGKEEKLDILGIAEVESQLFGPDGGFAWAAQVVIAPEFSLPDYDVIPVEVPRIGVDAEQVDGVLERMRQNHSEIIDVTDRPAGPGDIVVLNWKSTLDGQPLAEAVEAEVGALAEAEEYWVPIPAEGEEDKFLPEFTSQVTGLGEGESRDVTVTMTEDFQPEELRGKTVVFAVTVNAIKQRTLAPLDDVLAGKISEGKSLEEVRDEIAKGLTGEHERMRSNLVTNQILAHLNGKLEFDLPQHLVFNETQRQVNDMVYESYQRGADENLIKEHQGEILESAQTRAKMNLKTTFILEKIAEAEGIRPSDEEVSRRVMMLAAQSGKPVKKVLAQIQENNGIARIRHDLTIAKVLEFLRSKVNLTEVDAPAPTLELPGEVN